MCHVYLLFFRSIKWSITLNLSIFPCVYMCFLFMYQNCTLENCNFKCQPRFYLTKMRSWIHSLTLTTSIHRAVWERKKNQRVTWMRTTNKWTWKLCWRFTFILLQVVNMILWFVLFSVRQIYRSDIWCAWMTPKATCKYTLTIVLSVMKSPPFL